MGPRRRRRPPLRLPHIPIDRRSWQMKQYKQRVPYLIEAGGRGQSEPADQARRVEIDLTSSVLA